MKKILKLESDNFINPFQKANYYELRYFGRINCLGIEMPDLKHNQKGQAIFFYYKWNNILNAFELQPIPNINYGNVEILELSVLKLIEKHIYYEEDKSKYKFRIRVNDLNGRVDVKELEVENYYFVITTILPFINLVLKDGHTINELDWAWINWQSNVWEFGDANKQGRDFSFYDDDIRNVDKLYDYLKDFSLKGEHFHISNRGNNYMWNELYVKFRYIDSYVSELLKNALKSKSVYSDGSTVTYTVEIDRQSFEGSGGASWEITESNENEYRTLIEKLLMTSALRKFNLLEMQKKRFLKGLNEIDDLKKNEIINNWNK